MNNLNLRTRPVIGLIQLCTQEDGLSSLADFLIQWLQLCVCNAKRILTFIQILYFHNWLMLFECWCFKKDQKTKSWTQDTRMF